MEAGTLSTSPAARQVPSRSSLEAAREPITATFSPFTRGRTPSFFSRTMLSEASFRAKALFSPVSVSDASRSSLQ